MKKITALVLALVLMVTQGSAYGLGSWEPVDGPEDPIVVQVPGVVSAWSTYQVHLLVNDEEIKDRATHLHLEVGRGEVIDSGGLEAIDDSGDYLYSGEDAMTFEIRVREMTNEDYARENPDLKKATVNLRFREEREMTQAEYDTWPSKMDSHLMREESDGTISVTRYLGDASVRFEIANPTLVVTRPQGYPFEDEFTVNPRDFYLLDNTDPNENAGMREGSPYYTISIQGGIGIYDERLDPQRLAEEAEIMTRLAFSDASMEPVPDPMLEAMGMGYGTMRTDIDVQDTLGTTIGYEDYRLFKVSRAYFFYDEGRMMRCTLDKYFSASETETDQVVQETLDMYDAFVRALEVAEQFEGEYAIPEVDRTGPAVYRISLLRDGIAVFNNGVHNTGTAVDSDFTPVVKIEKTGDYDESEKLYLVGGIISPTEKTPIGFVERDGSLVTKINYNAQDKDVLSVLMRTYGPDRGVAFNAQEKVVFKLVDASGVTVSNEATFTVRIADGTPRITFDDPDPAQMQSQSESAFGFTVEDPDSQVLRVTVASPFGSVRTSGGDYTKKLEMEIAPGDHLNLVFRAPEVGNFLLNKEMEDLSMLALQEGTLLQAIADLEAIGLDWFLSGQESKADLFKRIQTHGMDLENFDEKMKIFNTLLANEKLIGKWKNINAIMNDINNVAFVSQVQQGAKGLGEELNEALTFRNKTVTEAGSDIGVATISLLQTGVGGFAAVAGYLTGKGGKPLGIGADKMGAFNLMTNVWKGNLKYWSKAEKIDRAQEREEMIPIIVTVVDEGGLTHRAVLLIPVVGLEV